jgi:hypothetical protein
VKAPNVLVPNAIKDVFPQQAPSRRSVTMGGLASIVLVIAATIVLLALLYRTEHNAVLIRNAAAGIAENGRGINTSTDSIMQLTKTNELGASILNSAKPLDGALNEINKLASSIDLAVAGIQGNAEDIDASAKSINGSASTIRGQVGTVNKVAVDIANSATGVNQDAASILATAAAIERGIVLINTNAAVTNQVVASILADADGINTAAVTTNHLACTIDGALSLAGVAC